MLHTPVRRLAAGATAAAVLAGALLIPAAIASADEIAEAPAASIEAPEAAVAELDVTGLDADAGAASEPASDAPTETPEQGLAPTVVDEPTTDEPSEPSERAEAPEQPTPTAASTDDPQDPDGQIAPGATLEVAYDVVNAYVVYAHVIGDDLEVTLRRPSGAAYPVGDFGHYHQGEYFWQGQPDGQWVLSIHNLGSAPVAPEYDLSYSTTANTLTLSTSVNAPGLTAHTIPVVNGVTGGDYTVRAEVTAPTGEVYTQTLERQGSTAYITTFDGLPTGRYLLRVWLVADGVTLQATRVVGVHVAESDPPVVVATTSPAAPNAAGWFRAPVAVTLEGSDAGAGYSRTYVTLDDAPREERFGTSTRVDVSGDGEHLVRYQGRDVQNNLSAEQELTLRIDTTAPVIALYGIADGARYEVGEEVFVEYQCGDATSGLVGDDCTADLPDGARVDTTTAGDYTFTIEATDLAGNTTRVVRSYSVGAAPDTTDPVVDVTVPAEPTSGWYLDTVTVRFAASDESGIRRIHYEYDTTQGTVSRDIEADTAEVTFDRSQYYTLSYWAEDAAGNRSESRDLHLYVDATAPWVNMITPADEPSILPNGHYAQDERVVVDFTCDDDASGIASCEGSTPDGELLPTGTPGTHELRIVTTDVAGHRTEHVVSYTVDAAPAQGGTGTGSSGTGGLAVTGAQNVVAALGLAALLLGAGAALTIRRRVRVR